MITSTTYFTLNSKNHTHECIYLFFLLTRKLLILANCSLWSNETKYAFDHLLHSDLSTIYFPSSLNKLKVFPSTSPDCSYKNDATRKKTLRKNLPLFVRQDNLPLGLIDILCIFTGLRSSDDTRCISLSAPSNGSNFYSGSKLSIFLTIGRRHDKSSYHISHSDQILTLPLNWGSRSYFLYPSSKFFITR